MKKIWITRLAVGGALVCTLTLAALAATQGSQSDPLVSLSYLTNKFTPSILSQVDTKLDAREAELEKKLTQAAGSGSGGSGSTYQIVNLTQGQKLLAGSSCEILLRSGTAVCVSDTSPGLVDMSSSSTLGGGGTLTANHLYLATIEGRGVLASTAVTLMVRGNYTIQ
ncbi:MAG TPA: hypothetical protein H9841_06430 [Candidatus Flavonifractor merdigallinarum]|uniref:Type IV pilus biogenesis protein PilP n=1 Tax=Candidatus Flavonifractor merdigallinarum TaxID=2838589 RepID=A0A9D1Y8I3_9FIRM|nr:hypothetical protein [Candidatus Flavonifractor merdigallinarum]